jgi:energy-coupling factor transporter ATP-binding protein EcfA2
MIQINKFTYTYPGQNNPALRELDIQIPAGQFCGVIGPNGAGKSSLCYALSGFIPHFYRGEFEGSVRVAGKTIHQTQLGDLAALVGFVFQNPFNQITGARFSVQEEIAFGLENLGIPAEEMRTRIKQAVELTGLQDLVERSPFELSGGQQQRLALASIFAMRPRVLVLDEPTSQLDPKGTGEVFHALRNLVEQGETTIVCTGHKLELISTFADRVIYLQEGMIIADGGPREVLSSRQLLTSAVQPSRYSLAAQAALEERLIHGSTILPTNLDEAIGFFR